MENRLILDEIGTWTAPPPNLIVLNITPQPFVWLTPAIIQGFSIPERCYYIPSEQRYRRRDKDTKEWEEVEIRLLGCELWNNTGFCKHTSSKHTRDKKKLANRYLKYKAAIRKLAGEAGFNLEVKGWSVYYFFPLPKRWSKKKKLMMRGQPKETKPDVDNMTKAIFDALGKKRGEVSERIPDERVAHLAGLGKYWMYDMEATEGYIEIHLNQPVYNPFGVTFINQTHE